MFSLSLSGVLNLLCLRDNHVGCCVLPADPSAVALLYCQYLRMGPVYMADR